MLTSITHMLTLAAFAVHAVLGCCWHHEHRASDGSCQQPAGHALIECGGQHDGQAALDSHPSLHLRACGKHCHASQALPDGQHPTRSDAPPVDGPRAVHVANACHFAASGEHSHDCDGTHCTYVRSGSTSMPPVTMQTLDWLADSGNRWGQSLDTGPQAGNRWALHTAVPLCTAAQACAVLQIWQI